MADRKRRHKSVLEDNKFYQTTSISGFGYISSSNNRIEASIWYIVIVLFTIITVINVYTLTSSFLERPTKTTVSMETFDKRYALKTMKMDLKLGLPGINPEYFKHWDTIPDEDWEPPTNVTVLEEVEVAIQELSTAEQLRTKWWPYGLLPLLGFFSQYISRCEQGRICHAYRLHPDLLEPTTKFIDHAARLGVNQHELIQLFGQQLLMQCGVPWAEHWWFTGIDGKLNLPLSFNDGLVYSYNLMAKHGIKSDEYENVNSWTISMGIRELVSPLMENHFGHTEFIASTEWYIEHYHPYLRLSSIGGDEKQVLIAKPENGDRITAGVVMNAGYRLFQKQKRGMNASCIKSNRTWFECQYASVNEFETT